MGRRQRARFIPNLRPHNGVPAVKCPICKGKGELPEPRQVARDRDAERRKMARTLRENGYSLRQIQEFCGWKSVRSVVLAVERKD